ALAAHRLERPLLLLLVFDGLVVHHPEATQEAVERLVRAVVGQRFQRLHPIRRLGILVETALDVLRQRALVALFLRKQVEKAHAKAGGVYTTGLSGSCTRRNDPAWECHKNVE